MYLNAWTRQSGVVQYDDLRLDASPPSPFVFDVPADEGLVYPYATVVATRDAADVPGSSFSVGGETLDRDFADYDAYRDYLGPLGATSIRLQAGWAKTEQTPGTYDWAWLDHIVDDVVSQGVRPWINVSYGNPAYPGGGGSGLGGGLPTSEEALAAWDAWVAALVQRYGDDVHEWEIWNEPDQRMSAETYAEFFHRTAQIIRDIQPEASIIGLAGTVGVLGGDYVSRFLTWLIDHDALDLVDEISYHPYSSNPDARYPAVESFRSTVSSFGDHITIRQGENGAPSEYAGFAALGHEYWSELTQAKWTLRRLLGDHARGIPSSLFQISDMKYDGTNWNPKGLLLTDRDDLSIIRPKQSYRAMQSVTAMLDDRWSVVDDLGLDVDTSVGSSAWSYRRDDGQPMVIAWHDHAKPADSIRAELTSWSFAAGTFDTPMLVDLRTGRAYAVPDEAIAEDGGVVTLTAPLYDSPVAVVDASLLNELQGTLACSGNIAIGDSDSGVADRTVPAAAHSGPLDVCLSTLLDASDRGFPTPGGPERTVGEVTTPLVAAGVLTGRERGALIRVASQASP